MSTSAHPTLNRETARELDRLALTEYSIPSMVLMENAGCAVARTVARFGAARTARNVLVACGPGNNGGDGLVAARHLHNAGAKVVILFCAEPGRAKGDALANLVIVGRMALPMRSATGPTMTGAFDECVRLFGGGGVHVVVDALFGTGLTRGLDKDFGGVIDRMARARTNGAHVVSVDIPSGLDADTGAVLGPVVRANTTVTFGAWKTGFTAAGAADYTGLIEIGDLGVPRELVERLTRITPAH